MYNGPVTFKTATDQIASRMDIPTAMKYTQLTAAWDDQFRRRAFFSARVAEADLLGELHRKAQAVAEGRMSKDQARRLIREFFVGDGADALARLGFAPPKDAKGISQLGSIPRLELILDTNVRMAQETGHYRKWETMKDIYPYGVWRVGYSKVHREAHLERDGKVYAFDHPIWRESPPGGEFNCHCRRDLMTADELAASGLRPVPKSASFQKSSLGFDPGADEWGDVPFGKTVPEDVKKVAEKELERDEKVMQADEAATRRQLIDQQKAYADDLLKNFDEDARKYKETAEAQYAAMQNDIERMERLDVGSPERAAIIERWRREDADARDAAEKEANDLTAQADAAAKMGKDAAEQFFKATGGASTPAGQSDENKELYKQSNDASANEAKIKYLAGQSAWKKDMVFDSTGDGRVVSAVSREIKASLPWMTAAEARAAAAHEMTLNARRMAGTVMPLYPYSFTALGPRPRMYFDKATSAHGAFYLNSGANGEIHLDRRYGKWSSLPQTVVHEFGHWFDHHARMKQQVMADVGMTFDGFLNAGQLDTDALMAGTDQAERRIRFGDGGTYWWRDVAEALFGHMTRTMEERYAVVAYADTMQSITRDRYGFGHTSAYARNPRNVGVEAFAETYLAFTMKDEHYRIVYPRQWAYIKKLLSEIKKKWGAT